MNLRLLTLPALLTAVSPVRAQTPANGTLLFQNLQNLTSSWSVDNMAVVNTAGFPEGPKGLAAADFDGDGRNDTATGNHDGTIAVLFGAAGGGFELSRFLTAGDPRGLRDVTAANVSGDARPEIIAAHPFEGKLYIFSVSGGAGGRTFVAPKVVTTWPGARAVAAGDFDGDGKMDLAVGGAGDGFREYRGDGAGGFTAQEPITAIHAGPFGGTGAKPVFTMVAWRRDGESRDRLAMSFAGAGYLWLLAGVNAGDPLSVDYTLPLLADESIYDLTMAKVSPESRNSGEPDLLTAVTWSGEVFIRSHTGAATGVRYPTIPQRRVAVPGAPRAMAVRDLNGDTWPDLLVIARTGHSISLFTNYAGSFSLTSQTPTGSSPRDLVSADFTGDGQADAAVINRWSRDLTLHRIDPGTGWFLQSPFVQKIPGGARSPVIANLDGLPGGELLYLSSVTGLVSIQKPPFGTGGELPLPVRYSMGQGLQTVNAFDLNGDGRLDIAASGLGNWQHPGGFNYRLQLADRTFGPLQNLVLPASNIGAAMAQLARDFNNDGRPDLAVAYYAGLIAYYEGTPGGLVHRRTERHPGPCGSLAAADMDQDGDLDLAGHDTNGVLAVVENNGTWFTGGTYSWTALNAQPASGVHSITIEDRTGDGDPDITLLGAASASKWDGGDGVSFNPAGTVSLATTFDTARLDYDGDGYSDMFALCPANTTASLFKGTPANPYDWWASPWIPYAVPAVGELAGGDLDGDGRPDLAGTGDHLWIALSGTPSPPLVPRPFVQPQPEITGVVINEIVASTEEFVAPGVNKPVDAIEIYNSTTATVDLNSWRLHRRAGPGEIQKPDFLFPDVDMPPGTMVVVYCSEKDGAWHAPFKLPAEGATLQLLNATDTRIDEVTYPPQQPDIAFARLFDGARDFVFTPFPGPGSPNYDSGPPEPLVDFKGVDTALLSSGVWRFRASAWSSAGISSVTVAWRAIVSGTQIPATGHVWLFDDGQHDDGLALDGVFAGDWNNPLPPGEPIEFFVTGQDFTWQTDTVPEGPEFTAPGQPVLNYTLALPATPPDWEISEVVSRNHTGLTDESGLTRDWAEWRYLGSAPSPVQDVFLTDALFERNSAKLYDLSRGGSSVTPGTARIVFLSDMADSGANPLHAPFGVNGDGDSVFLIRRLPSGATELLDVAKVPAMQPDTSWARMGRHGPFVRTTPTPFVPNAPAGGALHFIPGALPGSTDAVIAFPGAGSVEASANLSSWLTVLPRQPDNSFENVWREPSQNRRFFRVR